jgi:hypothetical protein
MAGDRGHVAGLGSHQAVDRSLAELLAFLAHGFRRGIGHPGAGVFADARHQPGQNADDAGTQHGAPILKDLAKSRQHGIAHLDHFPFHGIGERGQHLGKAERADQRGDQRNPAGELAPSEREPVVGIEAFLADLRDEQTERSHQPSFQRIVADDAAGHRNPEQCEPEEFIRPERQRDFGEQRRKCRETQHAEQRAAERA